MGDLAWPVMDCFDDNIAVELFDGSLSPEVEAEVEAHAATCTSCRQLLAELARSPSMAGVSPTLPQSPGEAHIDLQQGDKVGRFSILHRIGHGGMGVVFSAYDPKLDRKVALKLIRSTEDSSVTPEEAQARLLREAQAIAQQSHPNVISVYDVGTYKSEVYIAMELVEGNTLRAWLKLWPRPWRDILDKFREAGDALAAAHGSGLVHRDFKPENVLVGHDERVRVMDFGLARSLFYDVPSAREPFDATFRVAIDGVSELNRTLTKTGALLGTPRYMAPEQFLGGEADARSDQFSFCVALWEALYREHPFEGGTARHLVEDVGAEPRAPAGSKVPAWIHKAMMRGLAREPAARWPSMRALMSALEPPRVSKRRPWVAAAAAAMALLAMGLGAYAYRLHLAREDAEAASEANRAARDEAIQLNAELQAQLEASERLIKAYEEEQEELVTQLGESLEAAERVVALQTLIVEKEEELMRLRGKLTNRRPPPVPAPVIGLSIGRIKKAIHPRMDEIKSCFAEWRERQPRKTIKVFVQIEIGSNGAVVNTEVLGSLDKVLPYCLSGILAEVEFPPSEGITTATYTFDTSPTKFDFKARVTASRRPD